VAIADKLVGRFRTLCLGFPETSEADSWGHPNFRAGKRAFAVVEWFKGRPSLAFRLGATKVVELQRKHAEVFITPYGRGEWLSIWIDRPVNWKFVEDLADRSYRLVALKRMILALETARYRDSAS
jgi:predicted DNA-binding protein (MmcQ/YjbR family)